MYCNAPPSIGVATGFLVHADGAVALVTNYHVLSGRDADTDKPLDKLARLPDRLMIALPVPAAPGVGALSGWRGTVWSLEDEKGERLWITNPSRGRLVDVGVLPLGQVPELGLSQDLMYGLDPGKAFDVTVASDVSIIGFPEGLPTAGMTAIWKSGHVVDDAWDGRWHDDWDSRSGPRDLFRTCG